MKIADGESLLFTGDSITDCGRHRPFGTGSGLGEGYVAFTDRLMAECYPARSIKSFNTGVSGNTAIDLKERWQEDVLDLNPGWLSVLIGINDVWQQCGNSPVMGQLEIQRYESTCCDILSRVRPRLTGLILMTPYYIEANLSDPMRERMDAYGVVVERLAREFDAIFVNLQAAFDLRLAANPATPVHCGDRVHLNNTGHMIITKAFLTALQFDWSLARKFQTLFHL